MEAGSLPENYQPLNAGPALQPPHRKGFRRFTRNFLIILFLLLGVFVYWKFFFTYSTGFRTGLLQKFSYKGTIFKTYEGELILSSIRSNQDVAIASEKFYFSVTDKDVALQLDSLQGHFITVHYHMKNGTLPWRGDSRYLVDSVRSATQP